jgi:hypothetical protein
MTRPRDDKLARLGKGGGHADSDGSRRGAGRQNEYSSLAGHTLAALRWQKGLSILPRLPFARESPGRL